MDAVNQKNQTPLQLMLSRNCPDFGYHQCEVAKVLVNSGADLNRLPVQAQLAYEGQKEHLCPSRIGDLVSQGADPNRSLMEKIVTAWRAYKQMDASVRSVCQLQENLLVLETAALESGYLTKSVAPKTRRCKARPS